MAAIAELKPARRPNGIRPVVLCVDDEAYVLEGLRDNLRRSFDVRTASSGAEALAMLGAEPDAYSIVISDMRMPVMSGAVFLSQARRIAPAAVRMLLTGYAEIDAAIKAVNDGQLFRFLTKPCSADELMRACAAALSQHRMQTAERALLEQTLRGSIKALTDVLALASPAAFGRAKRVRDTISRLVQQMGVTDGWEVEVAAMLSHVGAVTLPDATAEKLYAGTPLDEAEEAMVAGMPQATVRILGNIPRLEGVMQILTTYDRRYDTDGTKPAPIGARMLRLALDHDRLEAEGHGLTEALGILRGRVGAYDPEVLDVFARTLGTRGGEAIREIAVVELEEDMTLAEDIRARSGQLLVARGFVVTPELVNRLSNLGAAHIREPLRVLDERAAAA